MIDTYPNSCSHSLVIHFLHTAVIALVTDFTCPEQDTFLSSLILFPTYQQFWKPVSAQLPKKADKQASLPKPSLPAQIRKDVLSLFSLQKETAEGV